MHTVRANTEPVLPTAPLHAGVCPVMSRSAADVVTSPLLESSSSSTAAKKKPGRLSCKSSTNAALEQSWSEERVEWAGIAYARDDLPPFETQCPAQLRAAAYEGEGCGEAASTIYNPTHCLWLATAAALVYRSPAEVKHVVTRIWGWDVVEVFEDVATDTHAFGMHNGHTIIISFRGTTGKQNWMTNLKYSPTEPFPTLKGAKVHNGFNTAFLSVFAKIRAFILQARATNPHMSLYLGGHSLGGALANLLLAYLSMPSNICSSTGGGDGQSQEQESAAATKSDGEIATVGEKKGRFRSLISRNKGAKDTTALTESSGGSFDDGSLATSTGAPQQSLSLSAPVDTVPLHAASGSLLRSEPILPSAATAREKQKKEKKSKRKSGKQTKPTSGDSTAAAPKLQRIKPVCDLNSLCAASRPGAAAEAAASTEGDSVVEDHDSPVAAVAAVEEGASEAASGESEATPRDSSDDGDEEDSELLNSSIELELVEDDEDPNPQHDVLQDSSVSSPVVTDSAEPFSPIHVNGVYTFGQPKVGNDVFACALRRHTPFTAFYRITHNNDVVPTVPRNGYAHCGRRMFVSQDGLLIRGEEAAREVRELNRGGASAVRRTTGGLTDHFIRAYLDHVLGHFRLNTKDPAGDAQGQLLGLLEVEQTILRADDVCMPENTEEFMAALQSFSVADALQSHGMGKSKKMAIKEAKKKASEKTKMLKRHKDKS